MFRPDRMSKVSVTGSKRVMPAVIEAVYELNEVHLSDYDGSWAAFDNGNPIEGADEASERLVTIRALESTLGIDREEVEPDPGVEDWEERLERVRTRVNDLDDERSEVREELRTVEERLARIEPFAELGIDLDLLSGYDSVEVNVVSGPEAEIESALAESEEIRAFETFTGGDVVAIVAAPAEGYAVGEGVIDDALVGVDLTRHELPETDRSPEAYADELESRRRELDADLERIDSRLEQVASEEEAFLVGLERRLTMEVQQAEAPLQFATTERAFVAEGWIPTDAYDDLVGGLRGAVGESVEIEELERAEYDRHGAPTHAAPVPDEGGPAIDGEEDVEAESEEEEPPRAATDGGAAAGAAGHGEEGAVTMDDQPPTRLDNLSPAKPFEMMVKMVNQPTYRELDPTFLVFLTFPLAFGFMIGDIGYGLLYIAMGYGAWMLMDSDAGKAIGSIAIWAGGFTVFFGYLYDDIFGVHMHDFVPHGIHDLMLGAGLFSKGIQTVDWVLFWALICIAFGLVHLNLGLVMGFINELSHGLKAAVYEKLSWILLMNGAFLWIFSTPDAGSMGLGTDLTASSYKPDVFIGGENVLHSESLGTFAIEFAGFPEFVGLLGLIAVVAGFVMVAMGEGIAGIAETPAWAFGHVLSYLRIVAVLLAKGVMAFVVNLLVFGAYESPEGYMYFDIPGIGAETIAGTGDLTPQFVGLVHMGDGILVSAIAILLGIVVFVVGHVVVLLLGITAAGIQMLRLEYVEFFQKFYEGGGEEYDPFGADRSPTAD